ncbi:MAG: sigma-70 family RNA polymerase sigma factor [Labilithrix sp.]|nr:sigma-70 family RNA polymerase sigma factor [Labilithrix sp.]
MAGLTDADIRAMEPMLRACARRSIGNPTAVDDVVQETLLGAVAGIASFDGRSTLRTWLVGILSRKVVDHFRRAKRWESLDEAEDELIAPASRTPDRAIDERRMLRTIERALQDLPVQERMAVVLCDVEELEREEVCNALDVTSTHLRVLLHRGRHRLRRALER